MLSDGENHGFGVQVFYGCGLCATKDDSECCVLDGLFSCVLDMAGCQEGLA